MICYDFTADASYTAKLACYFECPATTPWMLDLQNSDRFKHMPHVRVLLDGGFWRRDSDTVADIWDD